MPDARGLAKDIAGTHVLVTGGAGFIGASLVRQLLALGAAVTVIDDLSAPSSRPVPVQATLCRLRLPDPGLENVIADSNIDLVFHLAGNAYVPPSMDDPMGDLCNNTAVTVHLLEALRRVAPKVRLVYASSAAVYGSPARLPISEDTPICPVSPYGVNKFAAEQYVSLYARLYRLRAASLRLFSVYGPGQRKQVVHDLIAKLRANPTELFVHGSGSETRDFVFVDDVVAAALLTITRSTLEGQAYNVASGKGTTIHQLVDTVTSALDLRPVVRFSGTLRSGDAVHWVADITRLNELGYVPSHELREGVVETIAWFDTAP